MVHSDHRSLSLKHGHLSDEDAAEVRQHERDTRSSHTSVRSIIFQMFNVLVGTAVFALPSSVYTSGWLAFIIAQLLLAALSAVTSFYLLHTMQVNAMRPQTTAKDYDDSNGGDALQQADGQGEDSGSHVPPQQQGQPNKASNSRAMSEKTPLIDEHSATSSSYSSPTPSSGGSRGSVRPLPKSSALLGLPHLCSHYGGRYLFYLYEVGVIIYLLFSIWGVAATFTGQASATVMALFYGQDCSMYNKETIGVASCDNAYYATLAVLIVLAVVWALSGAPLSNLISDGAAVVKVVGFVLMIVTVLMALFIGAGDESQESANSHNHNVVPPVAAIGALSMLPKDGHVVKGVALALVYALLSYNISYTMAEVFSPEQWQWWTGTGRDNQGRTHSNETHPATRAALLVTITILITLFFYLVIGILCAALFGARAATLINLHWRQYEGFDFLSTSATPSLMISLYTSVPLWARLLQLTILIVPVLAAICSLPYLADAQSEALTRLLSYNKQHPHSTFILYRSSPPRIAGGKTTIALLSVLPPLLLTGVVGDLGEIFLWTAPIALFIQYLLPAVLLLRTRYGSRAETQSDGHGDGPHEWYLRPSLLIVLLVISSIISLATVVLLCLHPLW